MRRFAIIALLGLLAAGCGSGSGGGGLYARAAVEQCLKKHPSVKIDHKLDFVASTATGGAFHAFLPDNSVTVVFGASLDDANNINQAYHRFHSENVGVDDIIRQDKNAVMLFQLHPSDANIASISTCLAG